MSVAPLNLLAAEQRLGAEAERGVAADGGAQPPAGEGRGGEGDLERLIVVRYWRIHAEDEEALREFGLTKGAVAEEDSHAAYQARHGDGEQLAEGGKVVESGRRGKGD